MTVSNEPLNDRNANSFKAKSKAIYELVRPELPLAGGMCIIAGQIIVLHSLPPVFVGFMGFLTGFFISGAALISNDYFDLDVDRINHPHRPLPSGRISIPELMILNCLVYCCRIYNSRPFRSSYPKFCCSYLDNCYLV